MSSVALCVVEDCQKPKKDGKGKFCAMHKTRVWRHGQTELPISRQQIKICKHCSNEFVDTDKNQRALYCHECIKTKWRIYPPSNWEKSQKGRAYYKKYNLEYKAKLKKIVYDFYGAVCNCCGESGEPFLSVDHVNNDGYLDRKLGISGIRLYQKIIGNGFPADYQILCMNCNFAKKHTEGNICPHQM